MPKLENPKEKILQKTLDLLLDYPFSSITYEKLSKELNIKTSSLYHHFPSKEILGKETLKRYDRRFKNEMKNLDYYTDNPEKKIQNYFKLFIYVQQISFGMCPAGMLSTEIKSFSTEMIEELIQHFTSNVECLSNVLKEGRNQKKFQFEV